MYFTRDILLRCNISHSMSQNNSEVEPKRQPAKKSMIARICEILMVVSIVYGCIVYENHGFDRFLQYLIIPAIFFAITIVYSLPVIGYHMVSTMAFLDSIGINGLAAVSLIILIVICTLNLITGDKVIAEIVKLASGFTTGTFAQKVAASNKLKKQKKDA